MRKAYSTLLIKRKFSDLLEDRFVSKNIILAEINKRLKTVSSNGQQLVTDHISQLRYLLNHLSPLRRNLSIEISKDFSIINSNITNQNLQKHD